MLNVNVSVKFGNIKARITSGNKSFYVHLIIFSLFFSCDVVYFATLIVELLQDTIIINHCFL